MDLHLKGTIPDRIMNISSGRAFIFQRLTFCMEAQTDYLSHMKWQEGKVENNVILPTVPRGKWHYEGYLTLTAWGVGGVLRIF